MLFSFMSFSCPELTFDEMLAAAATYGYDGVEPRAGSGHAHGVELDTEADQRRVFGQKAMDAGIDLCCLAVSCRYADPETTVAQVDETLRYIDLAADIGTNRLRVFGGQIPDGISREAAINGVSAALSVVADRAAARGVIVCLETHDDWTDPNHVAEVLRRVDHPNIAANWDVMHPVRQHGMAFQAVYDILAPWVQHVHLHDATFQAGQVAYTAIGAGQVDHRQALAVLRQAGYTGFLSGEWINWEPYDVHLPRELATLREYI